MSYFNRVGNGMKHAVSPEGQGQFIVYKAANEVINYGYDKAKEFFFDKDEDDDKKKKSGSK